MDTTTNTEPATATAPVTSTPAGDASSQGSMLAPQAASTQSAPETTGFLNEKGEFSAGWIDRLPKEFHEDAGMLANFKDLTGLLKSYTHSQRMLGGKANAVQIPGDDATPEERAEFYRKLGVPDDIKEYPSKPDFQLPEGMQWDEGIIEKFNQVAQQSGIPPKAMQQFMQVYAEHQVANAEYIAQQQQAQFETNRKALAAEWGDKYDSNIALARRAAQTVGADLNSPGFSDPGVVKAFQRLASQISDDRLISAEAAPTAMIGKARALDIMRNESNPLYAKYRSGDPQVASLVTDLLKQG